MDLENEGGIDWYAVVLAFLIASALTVAIVFGIGRESDRVTIETAYRCSQYGDAMNKWAEERGFDVPCPNVDH